MKKPKQPIKPDYDSPWKQIIEELLEPFLEFFFPLLYKDVDFTRAYEIKSKELYKLLKEHEIGKRYADELIKVYLKDGTERWLLIHIEVQNYQEADFARRMFVYYYRIFDKYNHQTISLVILTDPDEKYRPDRFLEEGWGFKHELRYPLIKLIDFKNKKAQLEKSNNPLAIVVLTQLESMELAGQADEMKYDVKLNLIRMLYKKGYNKQQITELFRFIDWIIHLPEFLDEKISEEVLKLEEVEKMTYVTSIEKYGMKKGEKRGIEKGKKQGIKQGEKQGEERTQLKIAENMLLNGFSVEDTAKCTGLTLKAVKELKKKLGLS